MFFAVIDRATSRVDGRQSLMDIVLVHGTALIGYIIWATRISDTRVAIEVFFLLADHPLTTFG